MFDCLIEMCDVYCVCVTESHVHCTSYAWMCCECILCVGCAVNVQFKRIEREMSNATCPTGNLPDHYRTLHIWVLILFKYRIDHCIVHLMNMMSDSLFILIIINFLTLRLTIRLFFFLANPISSGALFNVYFRSGFEYALIFI